MSVSTPTSSSTTSSEPMDYSDDPFAEPSRPTPNHTPSTQTSAPTSAPTSTFTSTSTSTSTSSSTSIPTPPRNPFLGLQAHFLQCQECVKYKRSPATRHIEFTSLSLSLPHHPTHLHHLLSHYIHVEQISDVRCMTCSLISTFQHLNKMIRTILTKYSNCMESHLHQLYHAQQQQYDIIKQMHTLQPDWIPILTNAAHRASQGHTFTLEYEIKPQYIPLKEERHTSHKFMMIGRAPKLLCLHLIRLFGDIKLNSHIHFPLELDVTPFITHPEMLTSIPTITTSSYGYATGLGMTSHSPHMKYELCSVVVHHGTALGGHYTCYRRHPKYVGNDMEWTWSHISDDHVRACSVEEVLAAQAYLLFYQQIHDTTISHPSISNHHHEIDEKHSNITSTSQTTTLHHHEIDKQLDHTTSTPQTTSPHHDTDEKEMQHSTTYVPINDDHTAVDMDESH